MKLSEWLEEKEIGRSAFARLIGVTPAYVTRLCDDDDRVVPSLQVAARIQEATKGAVTMAELLPSAA